MMRQGASPKAATETAIRRIAAKYPEFQGAVIALNKNGEYGAACYGYEFFPYCFANMRTKKAKTILLQCLQ